MWKEPQVTYGVGCDQGIILEPGREQAEEATSTGCEVAEKRDIPTSSLQTSTPWCRDKQFVGRARMSEGGEGTDEEGRDPLHWNLHVKSHEDILLEVHNSEYQQNLERHNVSGINNRQKKKDGEDVLTVPILLELGSLGV